MRKIDIIAILVLIGLIAGFWIFNYKSVLSSPACGLEFTADVVLDLDGLDETIYIANGSEATSLEINKTAGTLEVNDICDSSFFLLKTSNHKVLRLSPTGGTADFVFSSLNESGGYVNQWTVTSSVSVAYLVGVPELNTWYEVKVNDVTIDGSPFFSGDSSEVSFNYTGNGETQVFTISEAVEVLMVRTDKADGRSGDGKSAILYGTLLGMGGNEEVDVWFRWGEDPNLSTYTETNEQSITQTGKFSKQITFEEPQFGKTFYFQAVAQAGEKTVEGSIKSFTISKRGGDIILRYRNKEKIIRISGEGKIEIIDVE